MKKGEVLLIAAAYTLIQIQERMTPLLQKRVVDGFGCMPAEMQSTITVSSCFIKKV